MSRSNKQKPTIMNKLNLSSEQLLEKKQLAEICGGGDFICTCWNEDGTKEILPEDAEDAIDCAQKCLNRKKESSSNVIIL